MMVWEKAPDAQTYRSWRNGILFAHPVPLRPPGESGVWLANFQRTRVRQHSLVKQKSRSQITDVLSELLI